MPDLRGIYAIPMTPFHEDLTIDEVSLRREVEFCLDNGAHGITYPVIASEFYSFSNQERKQLTQTCLDAVDGKVPMVVGVSATNTGEAMDLARFAEDRGAQGIIAMPMGVMGWNRDQVLDYYRQIAAATKLPMILQNAPPPQGTPLATDVIKSILAEVENIAYVKEEVPPSTHHVSEILDLPDDQCSGVFGGMAGLHFIEELERGLCGTMPACEFVDLMSLVFDLYSAGNREEARQLHTAILPLILKERLLGFGFAKGVLQRQGVLATARTRVGSVVPDATDWADFEVVYDRVAAFAAELKGGR